jgi:hypothetical protein
MLRKSLLVCGIVSALLYIGTDIVASLSRPGYSYVDQAWSELTAVDAPTRAPMLTPMALYGLLVIAFGIGVWQAAGRKRGLRAASILLAAYGAAGLAALLFAPMHQRGTSGGVSDSLHIAATFVLVVLTLSIIRFASGAGGAGFRLYSIATIAILILFGALAGLEGPRLAAGSSTPWLGLLERVNIYSSMLWIVALAGVLLRAPVAVARRRPHARIVAPKAI